MARRRPSLLRALSALHPWAAHPCRVDLHPSAVIHYTCSWAAHHLDIHHVFTSRAETEFKEHRPRLRPTRNQSNPKKSTAIVPPPSARYAYFLHPLASPRLRLRYLCIRRTRGQRRPGKTLAHNGAASSTSRSLSSGRCLRRLSTAAGADTAPLSTPNKLIGQKMYLYPYPCSYRTIPTSLSLLHLSYMISRTIYIAVCLATHLIILTRISSPLRLYLLSIPSSLACISFISPTSPCTTTFAVDSLLLQF